MRRSSFRVISVSFLAVIFISVLLPFSVTGQNAPKPTATITHSEPIRAQVVKSHRRHTRRHKSKATVAPPREIRQPSDDDKKLREIKEQKNKLKSQH